MFSSGVGVAKEYIGLPEETKKKFTYYNNERVYNTGDLGYYRNDGNIIKQGDGKPFRKMSDSEMHKAGLLKFNSEEDRIAHFYSKLNTDGRLIAAKCFYKNLDSTKLSEVADYVEQLADTPQFQKTDTKEEK